MNDTVLAGLDSDSRDNLQITPRVTEAPTAEPATQDAMPTGELYSRLVGENHIFGAYHRSQRDKGDVDMDFVNTLDSAKLDEYLNGLGVSNVPPQMRLEMLRSVNEEDLFYRIGRAQERVALEEDVAEVGGWKGLGLQIASYASDPAAFVIDAFSGGLVGRGRIAARFLKGGGAAAAAEGAIQAALATDGETVDPNDVALGLGTAFILGGAFGSAFGPRSEFDKALKDNFAAVRKEAAEAAVDDGHDSVGAASVRSRRPMLEGRIDDLDEAHLEARANARTDGDQSKIDGVGRLRFDFSASALRRAGNNALQNELVQRLMPSFVKRDKNAVNEMSAVEWRDQRVGEYERELQAGIKPLFQSWLESSHGLNRWRSGVQAVFNGGKHLNLEEDWNNAIGLAMQREIEAEDLWRSEYRELITQARAAGLDDPPPPPRAKVEHDAPPEVVEAARVYFDQYRKLSDELETRGIKLGRHENLDLYDTPDGKPRIDDVIGKRQNYMPRRLSPLKANELQLRIAGNGRAKIEELVEAALRQGRVNEGLEVDDEINKLVAKAYTHRLLAPSSRGHSQVLDVKFLEEADFDFLFESLQDAGLRGDELSRAAELLNRGLKSQRATKPDASNPARLKHRLPLDLSQTLRVRDINGADLNISMRDFFETRADDLMFGYVRWAGGEIGLSKQGLSSQKMERLIRQARLEANDNANVSNRNGDRYTTEQVDDLEWMYDRVMGRSVHGNESADSLRAARVATGIGFITRMGSAWWNAVVESGTLVAANGAGRILRRMPAYRDIIRNMNGKEPDVAMIRQLSMMNGGIGDTMLRGMFSARHEASAIIGRNPHATGRQKLMAAGEDRIEGLKKGAAYVNLLGTVTDFTRSFASVMGLDTLDDILVRGKDAPSWWTARAASWGLGEEQLTRIGKYLKSDSVKRGKLGEVTDLGNPPLDVLDDLRSFMYRYTGEMVQHVNDGALPRWMQKYPVMRVLTQFRSFTTAAWTKHLVKDLHHADTLAAQKLLVTGGMASLAYMARTYVDHYGTDEYEKRMTPNGIITGGIRYAVNVSLLPDIVDTLSEFTPLDAPFKQARTSGLASSLISTDAASIPIGKYAQDVVKTGQIVGDNIGSLVTGNGFTQPTKAQLRAVTNVLMIQTLWPLKPLENRAIELWGAEGTDRETINLWEATGLDGD